MGSCLETTEELFAQVEERIRGIIPVDKLDTILDNIGLPTLPINMTYTDSPAGRPSSHRKPSFLRWQAPSE